MKNDFEKMMNKAKEEKLTLRERELIRAHIEDFMHDHPLDGPVSMLSNYQWLVFLSRHVVTVTIVCVLLFAGGLSLSAEGAVPGDSLYGIKTGVNEKVLGLFATSPEARAEWQLSLADRRLNEIATLTKEQKLTPALQGELEANVDLHTALALGTSTDSLFGGQNQNASTSEPAFVPQANNVIQGVSHEGENNNTFISEAPASTTVSSGDISKLRADVISRKRTINSQKTELEQSKTFVKNKAATVMAEKLSLQAQAAQNDGNENEAQSYVGQASNVLSNNPLPETRIRPQGTNVVIPSGEEGEGSGQ
jgi:hypothetical protein